MGCADALLYGAKQGGCGKIVVESPYEEVCVGKC